MKATIEKKTDGYIITTTDGRTYHRITLQEAHKTCRIIGAVAVYVI